MRFFSSCTEIKHFNRALPFVQSERPAPSRRNENFTFNQNYPARSVKYWIVCTKKMVFPQKLLKRPFHFQTDWSGNGPAGKFWQMDWALLASFWKREFLELGNCLWFHSFIMKTTATDISKDLVWGLGSFLGDWGLEEFIGSFLGEEGRDDSLRGDVCLILPAKNIFHSSVHKVTLTKTSSSNVRIQFFVSLHQTSRNLLTDLDKTKSIYTEKLKSYIQTGFA